MVLLKCPVNQKKNWIFFTAALVIGSMTVVAIVTSTVLTSTKREQTTATFAPNLQTSSGVPTSMTGADQINITTSERMFVTSGRTSKMITTTSMKSQSPTTKMLNSTLSSTSAVGSTSSQLTTIISPLTTPPGTVCIVTKESLSIMSNFRPTQ